MAKFSDKLAKKRKEKNLSQEQLAERLKMSRQAISKWESGSSYPDMEKMMEICKVLDCTLEDLLDDGTIKGHKNKDKTSVQDLFKSFLDVITRSYNMIWSMSFKDIILFLLEMAFISFILFIAFSLMRSFFHGITFPILNYLPKIVYSIFSSLYTIIATVLGIILFFHLYKIRYLDYYITVEDEKIKTKTKEEPIVENKESKEDKAGKLIYERKREKVIIRDPKHSGNSFLSLLTSILLFIIKILFICLAIPLVIVFVVLIALLSFSLITSLSGFLTLAAVLSLIGAILLSYLFIEIIFRVIFNKKFNLTRLFIIFIGSIAIMGVGVGLGVAELATYDVKELRETNGEPIAKINTVIDFEDNLIMPMLRYDENKVVIDNDEQNVVITTSCPKLYKCKVATENHMLENSDYLIGEQVQGESYKYVYLHYRSDHRFKDYYDLLNNGLKNKIIYINSNSSVTSEIRISRVNYDKLLENLEKQ